MKRLLCPQSGMTLLEVLVSILIFSLGILGLVALQARAIQFSVDAEDRNRASLLANELSSEMLARQSLTLPDDLLAAWRARLANPSIDGLSSGEGVVTVDGNAADIKITWRAPSRAAGQDSRLTTQVVLR